MSGHDEGAGPPGGSVRAVLLTPGAGSSAGHHTLVALETALAPRPVVRLDFPYRLAGRRFPDRAPVLVAHIVEAVGRLCDEHGCTPDEVLLGGRSMGGRMCSMAVAEGLGAAGLVLVSYPLHPPRKPEQLRTAHFPAIGVPCLFVSGTRDDFATVDELTAATGAIAGPVTHRWVDGARHELDRVDPLLCTLVLDWLGLPAPPPAAVD
ncbi:MAG: alpha/beta family hydrolase [Acidimicrobiia bacterium]